MKEVTVDYLGEFPDIEVKLTYCPPKFFLEVIEGQNCPYWQVATVFRILTTGEIIYDPRGRLRKWVDQSKNIEWKPETIELKRQTTLTLLKRMENRVKEDMLADAYIWLIKAAEEAICVPLMIQNRFGLGNATLLLDTLRMTENDIYSFFTSLLQVPRFSPERLESARSELESLADRLYNLNIKTDREMWILAAFVSINESERRLEQSNKLRNKNPSKSKILLEVAVAELWQAYFLVAQNPRIDIKLDPWAVASFWNWFGFPGLNESWLYEQVSYIKALIA
ncbi:MAG: hypothetical protein ACTSW1_19480 [Candidatus Hodarchaeales archaeon]